MSRIFVHGTGAVTSAGWGIAALRDALERNSPLPSGFLARPGWKEPFQVRPVPPPAQRPAFLGHPRLRRANTLTHYAVAASVEALGEEIGDVQSGRLRLGIVVCLMPGCVAYTRRFYEEVLNDPVTASPLIFPETVFNAPASHLAAFLGSTAASCTLVGDEGTFLQGLAVAAGWLSEGDADACLVVGADEMDWIVADAVKLFQRHAIQTAGAGAVYLKTEKPVAESVELVAITDAFSFSSAKCRASAARSMRAQLPACGGRQLLCLGTRGLPRTDTDELAAWADWDGERLAPKQLLGEAFTASAAWQSIVACDAVKGGQFDAANVSVVGTNQQAIGARFVRAE